jgi:transcriptional regulator GlxA family with amidase domain
MEKEILEGHLKELATLPFTEKGAVNLRLRSLLAYVFSRYFRGRESAGRRSGPPWLNEVCRKMSEHRYFSVGVSAMVALSCRSPAHLCRMCRTYLNTTPSDYVNGLRLNFTANILRHSNEKISWIARQAGFKNMSHFYVLFAGTFGKTPAQFRKQQNI